LHHNRLNPQLKSIEIIGGLASVSPKSKVICDQADDDPGSLIPRFPDVPEDGGIDFQMGQARWASTETARKSPARARNGKEAIVLRAGPGRASDRAWAASSARQPGTGTAQKCRRPDAARIPRPPLLDRWIRSLPTVRSDRWGRGI
jgi:hypothetical protein